MNLFIYSFTKQFTQCYMHKRIRATFLKVWYESLTHKFTRIREKFKLMKMNQKMYFQSEDENT